MRCNAQGMQRAKSKWWFKHPPSNCMDTRMRGYDKPSPMWEAAPAAECLQNKRDLTPTNLILMIDF
jgi:hypothetical protein